VRIARTRINAAFEQLGEAAQELAAQGARHRARDLTQGARSR
jgi:hypothetical protein